MPEMPEVETLRRKLAAGLTGKRIVAAELLTPKLYQGRAEHTIADLIGARIEGLRRRAKYLIVDLSSGLSLVVHLGLAGQIVVESPDAGADGRITGGHPIPAFDRPLPHKQTHLILRLDDGTVVFLTDIRKFAKLWVVPTPRVFEAIPDERLGVEILGPEFTREEFERRLARRPRARLKPLLLDQSAVAGLGNIYVDESLWGARVHPLRTPASLAEAERTALYEEIRSVIDLALDKGVAEILNGRAVEGTHLPRVHGREGRPCPRCGTPIEKLRVGGRGTYICLACQPEPAGAGGDLEHDARERGATPTKHEGTKGIMPVQRRPNTP